MTAFSGIYSSLTGLLGFSNALDVVSDNIANLNTPGFKGSESLFRDIGPFSSGEDATYHSFEDSIGQGVLVAGQTRNFAEGQIQATGNPTDLAINGNGFFILNQNGSYVYTRAGQFEFDKDGYLVDSASKNRVQAIDSNGKLSDLQEDQSQTYASSPTTRVKFSNTLSTGQTSGTFTLNNISVIDASGTTQALTATFTLQTSSPSGTIIWNVSVTDSKSNTLTTGQIRFFSNTQSAQPSFDTINLVLPSATQQTSFVTLDFTDALSNSSGTASHLQVENTDGVPSGSLTAISFDANGVVQLAFSNGKTKTGSQVALASFSNPELLAESGKSSFAVPRGSNVAPVLGRAGDSGFGSMEPQNVELANIDLGQEFADIIVLQRGYQGSSQVLNVSSQLLDTLYGALSKA